MTLDINLSNVSTDGRTEQETEIINELRETEIDEYGFPQEYADYLDSDELKVRHLRVESPDGAEQIHVRLSVGNVTVGTQRNEGFSVELSSGKVVNFYVEAA